MRYLFEGKTRLLLGAILLLLGAGCATQPVNPAVQAPAAASTTMATSPATATTTAGLATTREQLCLSGTYSTPTKQEIEYNAMIAKDGPVIYLRRALDAYLDKSYKTCAWENYRDKKSDCIYLNDSILPALDQLVSEKNGYLQSKFIVLSTDIAVGGGEDITLLFKDKPDTLFVAWVYINEDEVYDLKGFDVFNPEDYGGQSIKDAQESYINQICDQTMGI